MSLSNKKISKNSSTPHPLNQKRPKKRQSKPVLYSIIRTMVKLSMSIFFQKIEMRHGEVIPERGPVVFVANHPNSIMDALVMGLVTKRKINYLGHAGLFSNKLKSWFLRSCGVIPVYRRVDAADKMHENVSAFEACYRALEQGEAIGIFPEGTSDMLRKVKKVKTGTARIVLEVEKRNGYQLGVQLIPIGLYFFSRTRFRSKVLLNVGRPMKLEPFFERYDAEGYSAVNELTEEVQRQLEQLTVNVRHDELDGLIRDIETLYRDELKTETFGVGKVSKATLAEFFLTQKIADCVEYYYTYDRERVANLQERIAVYKRKLAKLHLKDDMLREKTSFTQLTRASIWTAVKSLLGLPVAVYGVVNNFIPYYLAELSAKKFIDDRTKILSALMIGGGSAFLFFYALQVFSVWLFYGEFWASVYGVSLPLSGWFALGYLKVIRSEQQRLGLSFFLFTNRQLFNKMRRERKLLIAELDAIKNDYVTTMAARSPRKVSSS